MKKIYLSILFIACLLNVKVTFAQAPTCQFDYTWLALGKDGIYPDSATNLMSGTVGVPYVQNITVKIPYDTTAVVFGSVQTVRFARIDLMRNITNPANYGLPPGLSLGVGPNVTTSTSKYGFPGNDTSCMVIYGTPTTAGTYYLKFVLKTFVVEFPLTSVSTDTVDYYRIIINPASSVGLNENQNFSFDVNGLFPNPASGETTIKFQLPKSGNVSHSIYDALGKNVYSKITDSKKGNNSLTIPIKNLNSGVYFYVVEFEGKTKTKKLIVNND